MRQHTALPSSPVTDATAWRIFETTLTLCCGPRKHWQLRRGHAQPMMRGFAHSARLCGIADAVPIGESTLWHIRSLILASRDRVHHRSVAASSQRYPPSFADGQSIAADLVIVPGHACTFQPDRMCLQNWGGQSSSMCIVLQVLILCNPHAFSNDAARGRDRRHRHRGGPAEQLQRQVRTHESH